LCLCAQPDGEIAKTEDEESGRTFYVPELDEEKRPFRCILDVGIRTTSTGNRMFGALKVMIPSLAP
jgi:large subunit ribosomal protein L5e